MKKLIGVIGVIFIFIVYLLSGCGTREAQQNVKCMDEAMKVTETNGISIEIPKEWERYSYNNIVDFGGVTDGLIGYVRIAMIDSSDYELSSVKDPGALMEAAVKEIYENNKGIEKDEWKIGGDQIEAYKLDQTNYDSVPCYSVTVFVVRGDHLMKLYFHACSSDRQPIGSTIESAEPLFKKMLESIDL